MVSTGWSKVDHKTVPAEFLSTKFPESSRAAETTPRPAVLDDHTGVLEVEDGRSWRSPEGKIRRMAEEFRETEGPPPVQIAILPYAMAATVVVVVVEAGTLRKLKVKVLSGETHFELGSEA